MTRRTLILLTALAALLCGLTLSAAPVGATRPHDIDPGRIDATQLRLPASALPTGTVIDHSGISDNDDANGITKPADGFASQLRIIHQTAYDALGRITGYRMDFHYTVSGVPAGTEYLASVFPTAAQAKAAMADAISPPALITIIGQPLDQPCKIGDGCAAYAGPVPGSTQKAVLAVYTDGPILVESATQVPSDQFAALQSALTTTLYSFLKAADAQVQLALGRVTPTPAALATNTPVPPTSTPLPPTSTPTATATATPKPAKKKCKKGYKLVKQHGKYKCIKKK